MASWITHLIIADKLLLIFPQLDRRGFCVGNIAPDCNIESEDFSTFTPPREVTHWMTSPRKTADDCENFYRSYVDTTKNYSKEEFSFLLGYYAHLAADAEFMRYMRDENRVRAVWKRIISDKSLRAAAQHLPETWDSVKKLISKEQRLHEIYSMEAEYLRDNPNSGFLTDIVTLKSFPDYIGYLPSGCIVRKIGVMGSIPQIDENLQPIAMSRDEFLTFTENAAGIAAKGIGAKIG